MSHDNKRMHGGNTPGMVPGRGHERHEEPVRLGRPEPGAERPDPTGDAAMSSGRGAHPAASGTEESALGGHVATRSGTAPTPDDEK